MTNPEHIDHTEYPKSLKKYPRCELHFIIKDARGAMEAMPDGRKAGYYADEISYCAMELKRRNDKGIS